MHIKEKQAKRIIIGSVILSFVLFCIVFLKSGYVPEPPFLVPLSQSYNNLFASTILIGLFFPGITIITNVNHKEKVESTVPIFLRYVSEKIQTGVFLIDVLEESVDEDFGPLNKPLENALVNFHLTNNFRESMESMSDELEVLAADSLCSILVEAYETGGDLEEVLDQSVELFSDIWEYKRKRNSETSQYVAIIYLGVLIFCVMSWMLITKYFDPLATTMGDMTMMGSMVMGGINVNYQRSIMFWAAIMEAFFGGLVAGKISKGKVTSGTMHSSILMSIVILVFNLF